MEDDPGFPEAGPRRNLESKGGLENLVNDKIEKLHKKYKDLIDLIKTDTINKKLFREYVNAELKDVIERLKELKANAISIISTRLEEGATTPRDIIAGTLVFQKNEGVIEQVFRLCLGVFLLNRKDLVGDERVKKFLEEASFEELMWYSKILNKEGVIIIALTGLAEKGEQKEELQLEVAIPEIHEEWQVTLLNLCLQRINSIEEIQKEWGNISKGFKKKLKELREKLLKEGKSEKEVDEMIRNLEKLSEVDFEELKKLPPNVLNEYLKGMRQLGELIGEIEKAKEKGEKVEEHPNWEKIKGAIDTLGGIILTGGLLWFALFGFFLPLWIIEKLKGQIEKAWK